MKYVIIGGVAGGASAASRLRRLDEHADIVLFEKGPHISYANCGLPYYIGNTISNRAMLFVQTPAAFKARYNVDVRVLQEVMTINRNQKSVTVRDLTSGKEYDESYDKLLLSPGALPIIPPVKGVDLPNIFTLRNVMDCDCIKACAIALPESERRAVLLGGGFIGIEMAENLCQLGFKVTVVEKAAQILMPLDYPIAAVAQQHLRAKGVNLILNNGLTSFEEKDGLLHVQLEDGTDLPCNIAILSIGVRANTQLAHDCQLEIGTANGIHVNEYLQTSDENIYAVGDAIEFPHPLTGKPFCNYLAGPANAQARIAAINMTTPKTEKYQGSIATAIAKVFDLSAAATGLNERALKKANIPYQTVIVHPAAHASYYPDSTPIALKINFAPKTGQIYGAQAIGAENVDKQIDILAFVIRQKGTIYDIIDTEHAYAPPFNTAKSPVMVAGMVAENILKGYVNPIQVDELDQLLDDEHEKDNLLLIDVRRDDEFCTGSIQTAIHRPIDRLPNCLDTLPKDKKTIVSCEVGLRGYTAARILMQSGFTNVLNLVGGMKTYRIIGQHNTSC